MVAETNYSPITQTPYAAGAVDELKDLYWAAYSRLVRPVMIGDSQETYGGGGDFYIPSLNSYCHGIFGPASQSELLPSSQSYGGGSPPPRFCHRGTFSGSPFADGTTLPGFRGLLGTADTSSASHFMVPKCEGLQFLENNKTYLDLSTGEWDVEVYFQKNTSGPEEARIVVAEKAVGDFSFSNFLFIENSTGLGLNDSDSGTATYRTTTPIPGVAAGNRLNILVRGSTGENIAATGMKLMGSRLVSKVRDNGMVFNTFSAGGYRTDRFLTNHGNAGPSLNQFGPWDVIFVPMMANHLRESTAEYAAKLQTFIDTLRGADWVNKATQHICLVSDDKVTSLSGVNTQADVDRHNNEFPGVMQQVAEANSHVSFLNMNRFSQEGALADGRLLDDGTHLSQYGQFLKGSMFMDSWHRVAQGLVN